MYKPESLRALLAAVHPELARDPDRLVVFIDEGSMVSTNAEGLSFEYRYTLNLVFTDYAGHPDAIMVPLLTWIKIHQSELLANPANRERIAFEADLLSNNAVDLSIKIPLTERVGVHPRAGGGHNVEHYPEPQLEVVLQAQHWQIWLKDELIAEWDVAAA